MIATPAEAKTLPGGGGIGSCEHQLSYPHRAMHRLMKLSHTPSRAFSSLGSEGAKN